MLPSFNDWESRHADHIRLADGTTGRCGRGARMKLVPDSSSAVWAIGAVDGCTLIEVCKSPYAAREPKFVVVIVNQDGSRHCPSVRAMRLETAKRHATWFAGTY